MKKTAFKNKREKGWSSDQQDLPLIRHMKKVSKEKIKQNKPRVSVDTQPTLKSLKFVLCY